jgi:hypothetical protein
VSIGPSPDDASFALAPKIMNVHGIVVIQQLPIDVDTNYANVTRELCGGILDE